MILNSKIFRAYDIRGKAFSDFDETGFFITAQAFGQYIAQKWNIKSPKIFVSGDGRLSMSKLFPAIIAGLQEAHCEVVWGDKLTTPLNFFAFHEGGFEASLQISASHNPSYDNGLKFTDKNGGICGEQIQEILALTKTSKIPENISFKPKYEVFDFSKKYTEKLLKITKKQSPKKIIVDAGNSISGTFYPEIFRKFGHEVSELFCELDGNFPNHQPDPERPENLTFCQDKVLKEKADFGFVFDGDGDRVGIILKDGTALSADKILYVLSADFLSRNPNEKIVLDIMSSQTLIEKIKAIGGKPILSKTGHSYIEETMNEHHALLGGEQSGHFMFGENFYGHDDAMLASLRFLIAIENNPKLLDEILKNWSTLEEFSEKINVPDEKKFQVIEQIKPVLESQFPVEQLNFLDGVRIDFNVEEWAIIRCSNTSPKIAIRIEAKGKESLETKKEMLLSALKKVM